MIVQNVTGVTMRGEMDSGRSSVSNFRMGLLSRNGPGDMRIPHVCLRCECCPFPVCYNLNKSEFILA